MEHYCLMIKSGGEESFKKDFEENLKKAAINSAKITFFKKKMRNSKKIEFEQPLFPGYCFLSVEKMDAKIAEAAKKSKNFYHFLDNNTDIKRLQGKDKEILSNLLKFGETQGISTVSFDENQKITVSKGPLMGFEGKIIKVNRKRGRATIKIDLCNNEMRFDLAFDELAATQRPDTCKS